MERILYHNKSKFKINKIAERLSMIIYTVEKLFGEWPREEIDLIDLCDHFCFGGKVEICNETKAIVTIYTD